MPTGEHIARSLQRHYNFFVAINRTSARNGGPECVDSTANPALSRSALHSLLPRNDILRLADFVNPIPVASRS